MTLDQAPSDLAAQALARTRGAYGTGRTRSRAWRLTQLAGLERFCAERETEIVAALEADLRRPGFETWLSEIAGVVAEAGHARRHLRRWMRASPRRVPLTQLPGWAMSRPEPKGTVLVIGAWNYPVLLTLGPVVSALAAGNSVVLKPSELAPATSRLLATWIPHYLDPEAVAVVEGDGDLTQALLAQGVDHVVFTGGGAVGRHVLTGAAQHLTPATLELGGKCPAIVDESADLEITARRLAWVKLLNSGQTCIAPDFVLAHEAVRDELVERIAATIVEMRGADPSDQPIVNPRHFERLASALDATRGRIHLGGTADPVECRIAPTVVVDADPDEPLMTEEIFGPILPVLTVKSLGEAIEFVNERDKPLAAYLFSRSRTSRRRMVAEVSAGGIVVNHAAMHFLVPSLPFGGIGQSGMGAYHGRTGFLELSHQKAVLVRSFRPDPTVVYPPYSATAMKFIRRIR